MEKRWIGILIILIIGCSCMYFLVESSTTVGNAITVVNKTVVTLPGHFSIEDTGSNFAKITNKDTNEKVSFKDLGKKDIALDSFNNKLNELKKDYGINVINNSTIDLNNTKVYKIECQNLTTENTTNISICYTYTCYHTFLVQFKNYNDNTNLNKDLEFLIGNMKPDFKQSQD